MYEPVTGTAGADSLGTMGLLLDILKIERPCTQTEGRVIALAVTQRIIPCRSRPPLIGSRVDGARNKTWVLGKGTSGHGPCRHESLSS